MNQMEQAIKATLITNVPDAIVDLDSDYFLCSSCGQYDQERLEFVANTILPRWMNERYSLHQLSEYLAQYGIELWTAPDVHCTADPETGLEPFAFMLKFTQKWQGEVLIQCELYQHSKVH